MLLLNSMLKILNTRQIKGITKLLENQFGFKDKLDYVFIDNGKGKIYVISKDFGKIDFKKLRINSVGMYFCQLNESNLRLSIEGSQIVGLKAKKNVFETKQIKEWFSGDDIDCDKKFDGFVIIKYKNDFVGCGSYTNGKIKNFVNKGRRVRLECFNQD